MIKTPIMKKWFWGILFLVKLGWKVKYNLNHPYVKWRFELAYGGRPKITLQMIKEAVNYGYWAHCMKKANPL